MALRRLLAYSKHRRGQLIRASAYSILNKIADLAPPVLIGVAVDIVVKRENSILAVWGVVDEFQQLVVLAVLTVVVWGLESVFEYLFQWEWRNLAQSMQHDLRLDAYAHVQNLDMGWFSDRKSGRLMSILNDDVNQLERFLDGGANSLLQVGTTAICVSAVFFYLSPWVAAFAMLPIPIILWGSFFFQNKIAPRYSDVREKASIINAQLSNNLNGMETIKGFTSEEREVERIDTLSAEYLMANREAIRLSSAFSPLIRMVIVIGFTATLIYGGQLALDGTLSVGAYSVLVFLTQRLLWPLTRLGAFFDLYQRAMASSRRILDLLDVEAKITDGPNSLTECKGEIHFDQISFAYPDREDLLSDFSLKSPAGNSIAIVGPTGAGKSTLVRLLLRFQDPDAGCVRLDGHDTRGLKLRNLRQMMGLVSQSVYLFDGTVYENIAYGRPSANFDQIKEAAMTAEIHDFITGLPNGYQTKIGERGQKLSGGAKTANFNRTRDTQRSASPDPRRSDLCGRQ